MSFFSRLYANTPLSRRGIASQGPPRRWPLDCEPPLMATMSVRTEASRNR
jgi:hypothetical protein